jgi:hypothetical protein
MQSKADKNVKQKLKGKTCKQKEKASGTRGKVKEFSYISPPRGQDAIAKKKPMTR